MSLTTESLVAGWAQLPLVAALGWALVHFLWEGVLIALVLAAGLTVCRGAKVRYDAACVALLAMLAAFAITLGVSMPDELAVPPAPWSIAATADAVAGLGLADRTPGILELVRQVLPWVVSIWMGGALLFGFYRVGGWMTAQRMRRVGVCAAPPVWRERLGQLAWRIGVSKPLTLLESSLVEAPLVIGHLRPVILVPAGLLMGLPPAQLEAILLHELAHIRRFDYVVNVMQTLVESLLFYHPAVWWVSGLIRAERENCCDDAVVAVQGDARGYAAALVTLEERRWTGRQPALAATGGDLMNRIRRLLNPGEEPRAAASVILFMGLLLGLFCLLATARQTDPISQADATAGTEAQRNQEGKSPYDKWLNEDVVYIIAAPERAAFERLRDDEERDHFIEQFWARRDTAAGTANNGFKNEHYRRIAYANERFPATVPGWRTDRGRIYIVHGPPDEIESHPSDGFEFWMYRHIGGTEDDMMLEFVDPKHTGEYRLKEAPSAKAPARSNLFQSSQQQTRLSGEARPESASPARNRRPA